MDKVKIGQFIANCRKDKKLTQEQLAEKLGISINAISKWERGLNLPDVSLMKELCKILDITLNELFEGKKLTNNEMFDKAENNIISLMMTLKQLKIVNMLIQVLINLGIILTISSGVILTKLNQKIIFIIMGLFIWLFGMFLKIKVKKTIIQLEKQLIETELKI